MGKASHREVTEATEGVGVSGRKGSGGHRWLPCEKYANGKSIAQRSRRSQRGLGLVDERARVDTVGLRARNTRMGKAPHRWGFWVVRIANLLSDSATPELLQLLFLSVI